MRVAVETSKPWSVYASAIRRNDCASLAKFTRINPDHTDRDRHAKHLRRS